MSMTCDEIITVLQGFKSGKQIQGTVKGQKCWLTFINEHREGEINSETVNDIRWNFSEYDYRIAPKDESFNNNFETLQKELIELIELIELKENVEWLMKIHEYPTFTENK